MENFAIADGEESFFDVTVERYGKLPEPVEENDEDDDEDDEGDEGDEGEEDDNDA